MSSLECFAFFFLTREGCGLCAFLPVSVQAGYVPQCLHLCAGGKPASTSRVSVMNFKCVCPVLKWGGAWCVLCKVMLFFFICVTDLSCQISVSCLGSLPEAPGLVHLPIVPGPGPCPGMLCGTKARPAPRGPPT